MLLNKIEEAIRLLKEIEEYGKTIPSQQSLVDSKISDVLHLIENQTLKTGEAYRAIKLLHELRIERRQINNDLEIMKSFKTHEAKLGSDGSRDMLLHEVRKMDRQLRSEYKNRVYGVEELDNILRGKKDEAKEDNKLLRVSEPEEKVHGGSE